jgi:hypothetical protein
MAVGKKTRKAGHDRAVLSIPELRKSFHHVEKYLQNEVTKNKNMSAVLNNFRKEWKNVFHKDLSVGAAKSYVSNMMKKTKIWPKHSGGSMQPLTGAPLDYTTGPGVNGVYGNFPDYVNKGFVNPEPGILQDCGNKNLTPILPVDMGSNKVGGRRSRSKSRKSRRAALRKRNTRRRLYRGGSTNILTGAPYGAAMRPFVAQNPATMQHDAMSAFKALPTSPSGETSNPTFSYRMSPHISPMGGQNIAGLDRSLLRDVTVL